MPDEVQGEKIEIQPDDTLTTEVEDDLRIERDGPGEEVDPADELREKVEHATSCDVDEEKVAARRDVHLRRLTGEDEMALVPAVDDNHAALIVARLLPECDIR